MFKLHGTDGWWNALSVATLVVLAAMVTGGVGVASAARAGHSGLRAWLEVHGVHVHVHRSDAGQHGARVAVVGGTQISIEQAPWQAAVLALFPVEEGGVVVGVGVLLCGSSILDSREVLTAAHCMFNPRTEERLPAEDVAVVAGVSDLAVKGEPDAQFREAGSLRVHPYYSYSMGASADDVAVVTLSNELTLSSAPGTAVDSIGVVPLGATPPEGTQLNLAGYGEENPITEELNGTLNSIGTTLGLSRRCGGEADAVFLCASAAKGSACFGDSGSGLTTTAATPTLIGLIDTVSGSPGSYCRAGSTNGFANLAAPEIRGFIEGEPEPPRAPRGGDAIEVSGVPKVGHSLTCKPGSWSNQPAITYLFTDSSSGSVLQSGSSSTYALSQGDVGRTIFCEVRATNAGGTGTVRTTSLRAIEAGPSESPPPTESHSTSQPGQSGASSSPSPGNTIPPAAGGVEAARVHNEGIALLGKSLVVQSGGMVLAKLDCKEIEGCNGVVVLSAKQTVTLRSGRKKSHTVTIGTANFSLSAGQKTTVKIHLDASGRALLSSAHGRLAARLAIEETETPTLTESVHLLAQQKGHGSLTKRG
jgi:hypothetical protein